MDKIKNEIQILMNLFNSQKFNDLIIKSKKVIRKYPNYLILYNILGSAYQNIGSFNLAKEIFIKGNKYLFSEFTFHLYNSKLSRVIHVYHISWP